MALKTACD